MLFDRAFSIFTMTSVKEDIEYFNFWCNIQLDQPLLNLADEVPINSFGVDMSHALVLPAAASLTESCTAAAARETRGRRGSNWLNWWQSWWTN